MKEFNDYIVYERPQGREVKIVFEIYRNEILHYYFQFRHNENSEWQKLLKGDEGYFDYTIALENGEVEDHRIKFPTDFEIRDALDVINKKYNILEA